MADPVRLDDDSLERLAKVLNNNRKGTSDPDRSRPAANTNIGSGPAELLGVITAVKDGGSSILQVVNNTMSVWQEASKIGIGFNNDAVGLRASIGVTRLGVDEYFEVIKRSQQGFTSLGGSMTDASQKFTRLSQAFSDSAAADELRAIGYTTKEFNEVLALQLAGRRVGDAHDKTVQAEVNRATENLAMEMDKVSQLTGVSRQAQMDAIQESQKNARVQATLQDILAEGGKKTQESYNELKAGMTGLGLGKLGDELYTGQAKTKEAIAQLNALGPAGTLLQNAINATREAKSDDDIKRAKALLQQAEAAVAARTQESSFRALVRRGEGETADAARNISISTRNFAESLKSVQDDAAKANKSLTVAEAEDLARKRLQARQEGYELDIVTGQKKVLDGATTTQLATQTAARIKDSTVILYQSLEALNAALGKSALVKKGLEETANIKTVDGVTTAASQRFFKDSLQTIPQSIDAGTLTRDLPKILGNAGNEVVNILKTTGVEFGGLMANSAKTFAENLWAGVKDWWAAPPGIHRDTGTIGHTGGLFEPADFFGKIHKGETVFTPQQLENFAKNIANNTNTPSIPTEFANMMQNIQTDMSKPKEDNTIDLFANVFRDIQTTLSPANAPSKNPADNTEVIIAAQQMQMAAMKFVDIASLRADVPEVAAAPELKFDNIFANLFNEFKEQTVSIGDNFKSSIDNLASIVPKDNTQNQARDLSRTIPSEVKQAKVESDRQAEDRRRTASTVEPATSTGVIEVKLPGTSTLDDLKERLDQLNNTMREMLSHSSELVDTANKQVRAAKRLDPNVALR